MGMVSNDLNVYVTQTEDLRGCSSNNITFCSPDFTEASCKPTNRATGATPVLQILSNMGNRCQCDNHLCLGWLQIWQLIPIVATDCWQA